MCSASCPAVFCCVGIVLRCAVCGLFASVGECGVGAAVLSFAFFWLCSVVVRCGVLCECLAFCVVPCCGRGVVCCALCASCWVVLFVLLSLLFSVTDLWSGARRGWLSARRRGAPWRWVCTHAAACCAACCFVHLCCGVVFVWRVLLCARVCSCVCALAVFSSFLRRANPLLSCVLNHRRAAASANRGGGSLRVCVSVCLCVCLCVFC